MIVPRELRRWAHSLLAPILGLAATGYFAYHLVEGDRGLRAWFHSTQELRDAKAELAVVKAAHAALARRVAAMGSAQVDPDLLDQQVRATLDLAAPDEIVIMRSVGPP